MTTPLDNKRLSDMSIDELQERQVWLENFPTQWWSNKVGWSEQRRRDELNVRRKAYLELVEAEIALRRKGGTQ